VRGPGRYRGHASDLFDRSPFRSECVWSDVPTPTCCGNGQEFTLNVSVVVPADRCTGEAPLKNASAGCLSYCLNRFVLRWSSDVGSSLKEIVRQQRNLSPPESVREVDEYQVAGATGLEAATSCVSEAD